MKNKLNHHHHHYQWNHWFLVSGHNLNVFVFAPHIYNSEMENKFLQSSYYLIEINSVL